MPVRRPIAVLLACASIFVSGSASAYVRTLGGAPGPALFWVDPRATLEVSRPPDSFPVGLDDFHAAVEGAAATWSYPALDCTTVALTVAPGFAEDQVVAPDGHNRVIARTGAWCRDPVNLTNCHDPSQVAVTTVFSRSHPGAWDDGAILEADIELNDVAYEWAVIPDAPFSGRDYANAYDLRGALTHEVGHFIGLAHDCMLPAEYVRFDDAGNVSPPCSAVPAYEAPEILGATMYAFMNAADVSWRSLSSDETRAACSLYSRAGAPVAGWCAVGASPDDPISTTGLFIVTGVLAALVAARRKRRLRHG